LGKGEGGDSRRTIPVSTRLHPHGGICISWGIKRDLAGSLVVKDRIGLKAKLFLEFGKGRGRKSPKGKRKKVNGGHYHIF